MVRCVLHVATTSKPRNEHACGIVHILLKLITDQVLWMSIDDH